MPDFDLAVIGAGAAGLSVTAVAAQLGVRVVLIERDLMGGDCLNFGCVPSKALLAASHAAQTARGAGRFGLRLPEPVVDWSAVREHVHGVIATIAPTNSEARFRALGATVLRGEARFVAPDALAIDGRRLTARRIVIAAGSTAVVPPIPGLDQVPHLTNTTLFDLAERPDHLLLLGGGPIGLEMADAFAGLGSRVSVVEAATIAGKEDPELVAGLRACLAAGGVSLLEGAAVASVEPGPVLVMADGRRIAGSHLLVAVGRRPTLDALDLATGAVQASSAGIATDRGLRSVSNRRVYAVGDIADPQGIGPRAFTHVGSYHAGIVIRRALFRLPARIDYAALPRVTYTRPELAQVGLTEAEARAAGHRVSILRWPLADNERAIAERETAGLVKLVVARNRVVGAGILAPNAGEMIGTWTLAIARRIRLDVLASLIVPYPTRAEAAKRAAGNFFAPRLFAPRTKALVRTLVTVAVSRPVAHLAIMMESAGPPRVRPRQSLSARLLLLTALAVLMSEVVVFLPHIAHEQFTWLAERQEDAAIAVAAATSAPTDPVKSDEVLRLSDAIAIRLTGHGAPDLVFGDIAARPDTIVDFRHEGLPTRIALALRALLPGENRLIQLTKAEPSRPGAEIEIILREQALSQALRRSAGDFVGLALAIAGLTGGMVYIAVLLLLVRPMRRITGSITAFRADPERATPLDPSDVAVVHDEIAVAGQELAAMQHELRAALWRNARLAAFGTVFAKVSHDLRSILTPALLSAERLQLNTDPRVQRAGEAVVQAVDRATELVRRTLDYAREGPPPLDLQPVALAPLVGEAAETTSLRLENGVDPGTLVQADRVQLFRVLINLLRNAAEAGAHVVRIAAERNNTMLAVEIMDDGPGLPDPVRADLFRPFAGSVRRGGRGLGLAIARDLMVAQGGDIELVATGATGTTFRLTLRLAEPAQARADATNGTRVAPAAPAGL